MKKDDHFLAGSLLKSSGIKGEVILKFNNDRPKEIQKLESIFIDIDNKLVPFFIEKIKSKSSSTAIVNFEGIDSEEKSMEFMGTDFYLTHEQVDVLKISTDEPIDVAGYKVKDQNNKLIGEVIEYIDIAKNPLLNVKTDSGEILIPAKDELIIEVDDDLQEILINIPEGLLDLD